MVGWIPNTGGRSIDPGASAPTAPVLPGLVRPPLRLSASDASAACVISAGGDGFATEPGSPPAPVTEARLKCRVIRDAAVGMLGARTCPERVGVAPAEPVPEPGSVGRTVSEETADDDDSFFLLNILPKRLDFREGAVVS
jgi:hypothetical protein